MNAETLQGHDGTPLFVENHNGGHELTVILCDGIGCDGFVWSYLVKELKSFSNLIHPHMRGHGKSGRPVRLENLTMKDFAKDLEVIVQHYCTPEAPLMLLGHSMGVQVSLEYIHRNRDRVVGAALICGSFEHPATSVHYEDKLARALPMLKRLTASVARPISSIWRRALKLPIALTVARFTETHPDHTDRSIFEPYLAHLADMDLEVFFHTLDHANQHSSRSYLAGLDLPVLVVAGEDDRITPPMLAGELCALLPNAKYLGITDATHIAPVEFPNEINPHVISFIKSWELGTANLSGDVAL